MCSIYISCRTTAREKLAVPMAGLTNLRCAVRFLCHAAVTAVQIFLFPLPDQRLCIVKKVCIYTYIWLPTDCIWIVVATTWHCVRNIFTRIESGAKSWLDIYHRGAGLAVTGRIRDIGQSVLQSSFQTGSSRSPSHCHIFCLIAFLEAAYTKIYNNYPMNLIIICINDNNAIMNNNNYERLQDLIFSSKFLWIRGRLSSGIYRKFGHEPSV